MREDHLQRKLPFGEIDVWWLSMDLLGPQATEIGQCLSPEEKSRARRFVRPEDQARFTVCRGALRRLLASYVGLAPAAIEFLEGEHKKPYLSGHPVEFNLSHSGRWGVVAVGRHPLGIDIEEMRPGRELDQLVERFFAPAEREAIAALEPKRRFEAFYRTWSRKEAFMKATGEGLHLETTSFAVPVEIYERALQTPRPGHADDVDRWRFENLLTKPSGYSCCLVHGASIRLIREDYFDPSRLPL